MAFERSTSTPLDFDTAGGHERPSGAMPMDARQGIPGVRVNPAKSADSPPAAAAGGGLGNTAKSVRQTQSEKERVRHLQTHFGKTAAQDKREAVRVFMSCAGAPADTPLDDVLIYRVKTRSIFRIIAEKCPLCVIEQDPYNDGVCRIGGVTYHDFHSLCKSFDIDFYQYLSKE